MKTRKILITVFTIAVFAFIFTACKKDDSRKDYYGTWTFSGFGTRLVFSADKFSFVDELNDLGFSISPITWTAVENAFEETKDDYPTGYKITGTVLEHHGNIAGWHTGTYFDEDWAFFIHTDRQKMIEQGLNRFWYQELMKVAE